MQCLPKVAANQTLGEAVVLFPDEFETAEVLMTIEALQREHPLLRLLLVTNSPQRYRDRRVVEGVRPPLPLAKPAFGWSILDAIRASSEDGEVL